MSSLDPLPKSTLVQCAEVPLQIIFMWMLAGFFPEIRGLFIGQQILTTSFQDNFKPAP